MLPLSVSKLCIPMANTSKGVAAVGVKADGDVGEESKDTLSKAPGTENLMSRLVRSSAPLTPHARQDVLHDRILSVRDDVIDNGLVVHNFNAFGDRFSGATRGTVLYPLPGPVGTVGGSLPTTPGRIGECPFPFVGSRR